MAFIVGIVCEYDPFHLGHKRQYELIRQKRPDAQIVCIMSGCFTQRGMPALHSVQSRAKQALLAGADVVLELPTAYAVRDAEHFALGAVSILDALGCIDALCFGTEDDIDPLYEVANLLENPTPAFKTAIKAVLDQGKSYVVAQSEAIHACLGMDPQALAKPNNILGLCYLRALKRLHSAIKPMPVMRIGGYHETDLQAQGFPSATAVRKAFLAGENAQVKKACGYDLPKHPVCLPDALDLLLLHTLRTASKETLRSLPYCNEGLENRLHDCASRATTRAELLSLLKTKRYAHARLSRLCTHAMLGITAQMLLENQSPSYVRLIGFAKERQALLKSLSSGTIPLIANATQGDPSHPLYALDHFAYNLWALGAHLPMGQLYQSPMVVVSKCQTKELHP